MDSGLYAAYTGLLARTQALDTAANNLANAGTNGFRAERDYFRNVLASGLLPADQASQVADAVNSFGVLGGNMADLSQGTIVSTSNPLDLALNGRGFFAITSATGRQYTRDGSFTRSSAGTLATQSGEPVLSDAGQPIPIPAGTIDISTDGTISAAGAVVGKVGVFDLPPGALIPQGANRFAAAPGTAVSPGSADIRQGAIEGANQDAVHGTMQLILIQRQAEMMQKALGVFSNDFDKAAVDQIAKV